MLIRSNIALCVHGFMWWDCQLLLCTLLLYHSHSYTHAHRHKHTLIHIYIYIYIYIHIFISISMYDLGILALLDLKINEYTCL